MTFRHYALLFSLGLFVFLLVAASQTTPGYMDAEYYFAGGLQLVNGHGFTEPYIWNYLADPDGLPTPSHAYWMPLASIIAVIGMAISGVHSFSAGQIGFILLATAVPPLTAALSYSLLPRRDLALLAGILALIPGFYLPFLTTTATFAPYMFLGAVFFLLVARILDPIKISQAEKQPPTDSKSKPPTINATDSRTKGSTLVSILDQPANVILFLLGILVGLMVLVRSDGLIYLFLGLLVAIILARNFSRFPFSSSHTKINSGSLFFSLITDNFSLGPFLLSLTRHFTHTAHLLLGFLIPTLPWWLHNLGIYGNFFPEGSSRVLWLTDYNQLFSYPASILTSDHWWSSGWDAILETRLWSLSLNLQTTLAVQGMVFLFPLMLIALVKLRRKAVVRLGALAYFLTLAAMTLAFPFAGARGGFFHSSAALQPLLWSLAPIGLDSFVSWGVKHRGWKFEKALPVFSIFVVALALMFTAITSLPRLTPSGSQPAPWNQGQSSYSQLETALVTAGAWPGDIVLVNNPPGYYLACSRPALVIPDGGPTTTLAVAARYGARYLLLDQHHPQGLKDLYQNPETHPDLHYLTTFESTHIFKIVDE